MMNFSSLFSHHRATHNASIDSLLDSPLMNTIDSFQLLTLHNWLEQRVNKTLPSSFLFNHSTPHAIERYFCGTTKALSRTNRMLHRTNNITSCSEPIAIVGVAFKLPSGIENFTDLHTI